MFYQYATTFEGVVETEVSKQPRIDEYTRNSTASGNLSKSPSFDTSVPHQKRNSFVKFADSTLDAAELDDSDTVEVERKTVSFVNKLSAQDFAALLVLVLLFFLSGSFLLAFRTTEKTRKKLQTCIN